jgi:DNA adenine methylase
VSPERPLRINLVRMEEELSDVHLRLSKVMIENLPWDEVIKRYDRPQTFFYLDPPYYKAPCYKHNFYELEDYAKIASILRGIKGSFILSLNDHPDIREIFKDFRIIPVKLNYSVGKEKTTGEELIIMKAS